MGFSAADSIERGVGGIFGLSVGFVDLKISITLQKRIGYLHYSMSSLKSTDLVVMSTVDTRT